MTGTVSANVPGLGPGIGSAGDELWSGVRG